MAAWIKTSKSSDSLIFDKYVSNTGYQFYYNTTGKLTLYLMDTAFGGTGTSVNNGSWHHVAVSATRSGNAVFYVDGNQVNSVSISAKNNVDLSNAQNFALGVQKFNNTLWFNGQMDDNRIYNYALTANQIKQIYNNGAIDFAPVTGSP
jgi:hypothetical protein